MDWVWVALVVFSIDFVCGIHPKSRRDSSKEISNGVLVDYRTTQTTYSFMARLVMDAAYRCGGAVVSDR